MTVARYIEWCGQSNTHWAALDIFENLSNGCRVNISNQDQITIAFWWFMDQTRFSLLEEGHCDLGIAKSIKWLSDNSERILQHLHATPYCSAEWATIWDRILYVSLFFAHSVDRIASYFNHQDSILRQRDDLP